MSLQDSLFIENVEEDIQYFLTNKKRKRVLVFPPDNNYKRFLIHQLVQDYFGEFLQTFSIGQGFTRRIVVCYKSDVVIQPQINGDLSQTSRNFTDKSLGIMGIESQCTSTTSPEHITHKARNVKSTPTIEIYRPPAARRVTLEKPPVESSPTKNLVSEANLKTNRQKRPDRAVYVPRHRRSNLEIDSENVQELLKSAKKTLNLKSSIDTTTNNQTLSSELKEIAPQLENTTLETTENQLFNKQFATIDLIEDEMKSRLAFETIFSSLDKSPENEENEKKIEEKLIYQNNCNIYDETANSNVDSVFENSIDSLNTSKLYESDLFSDSESGAVKLNLVSNPLKQKSKTCHDNKISKQTLISEVLIISSSNDETEIKDPKSLAPAIAMTPPEKKVKKVERPKSKPALPPVPAVKLNRDECDWDSLFDDNGDCLDPTLIEELTSSVGEVVIEKPKSTCKAYSRSIEVSSDEFAHVLEIYNFPSEFKSSDLAAIFSPFKNGGFELKWVDDTHCLGVFSSPVVAAEVLSSNHPFVKTRPLCEATPLSKTKARRSSEFLQPYRNRPETCAALARRLVTKSLGVTLATAKEEREQEKIVLREAKEKRRLANKQRDDVWEGIIAEKPVS